MNADSALRITLLDHRSAEVAAAVQGVLHLAYAQEAALLQVKHFAPLARTVADLQASTDFYLGAWLGDTLAGALSVGPDEEPGQICITTLVVHPAHQRQGVARALVQSALQRGGGAVFVVATATANAPALTLYRGLGFVDYRYGQITDEGAEPLAIVKLRRVPPAPPSAESPDFHTAPPMNLAVTPPPARAVLADDERLMREQLRARLAEVWPDLQIVAEAKNGLEAVQMVAEHRPDIVFLDIRMPGLTGVEAARQIAQLPPRQIEGGQASDDDELLPEIVFITAYDQYAVEAFEQGVADYVLKPAERDRLQLTVDRIKKRLAARQGDGADAPAGPHMQQLLHQLTARLNPGGAPQYLQWIQATVGQAIQMIPVDEVLFFISDEKYTRVQTAQVEALIRKPIKELVDEIDPQRFWQIHRSTLVNVKAIAGVTRDFRGRQIVTVKGHGEKLEVSRSYTGLFKGM